MKVHLEMIHTKKQIIAAGIIVAAFLVFIIGVLIFTPSTDQHQGAGVLLTSTSTTPIAPLSILKF